MSPFGGELRSLLDRCRAGEAIAWEELLAWVRVRAPLFLSGFRSLNTADKEDLTAEVLGRLVEAVRHDQIRGVTNPEIEAYVRRALRNHALNLVRGRRVRAGEDRPTENLRDPAQMPGEQMFALNLVTRAREVVMKWPPEDRYIFFAKLEEVPSARIKATLEQPPYGVFISVTTVDTRYHKLRKTLRETVDR